MNGTQVRLKKDASKGVEGLGCGGTKGVEEQGGGGPRGFFNNSLKIFKKFFFQWLGDRLCFIF